MQSFGYRVKKNLFTQSPTITSIVALEKTQKFCCCQNKLAIGGLEAGNSTNFSNLDKLPLLGGTRLPKLGQFFYRQKLAHT